MRRDVAEHRQLTMIFLDIVDSSGMNLALGTEKYRDLLRDLREATARIVKQYQGYLSGFIGDGVLIYFGYPIAKEDDALRGVHSCLDLQEAVVSLNERHGLSDNATPLQVRFGVHTGTVIAGDIHSESTSEQMAVVGEAANIAARLQNLADPGAIVISEDTYDLVAHSFDCHEFGTPQLKGASRPIKVFQVSAVAAGGALPHSSDRSRMVGRSSEVDALHQLWEQVATGSGTSVLITGEAGVGKSRLVKELSSRLRGEKLSTLVLGCSSMFSQSALQPVIRFLSEALGLNSVPRAERFDRLVWSLTSRFADPHERIAVLSNVLSISRPPDFHADLAYTPQQEKALFQEIVAKWLLTEAEIQPVLLIVEDLHSADPSTIELLSNVLPRLSDARLLTVMTCREDASQDCQTLASHTVPLDRLNQQQALELVRAVTADVDISHELAELLVAQTDGVPLFIEEMTRAVVDTLAADPAASRDLHELKIPTTLQQSLNARIDRVNANRDVLRFCSSLGRDFSEEMISKTWDGDQEFLDLELKILEEAGILISSGQRPLRKWAFRHALVQEKIHEYSLSAQRKDTHAKIAVAMRDGMPAICADNPEIPARHFLEAGRDADALPFLRQATHGALRRSAHREASYYLDIALRITRALPPDAERNSQLLELLLQTGVVQTSIGGYASRQVGASFQEAHDLSRSLELSVGLFPALHGLYRFYFVRAEVAIAMDLASEMLVIAASSEKADLAVEAERAVANCLFLKGDFDEAAAHYVESLETYNETLHADHRYVYGIDPYVGASSMYALNLLMTGDVATALRVDERATARSEALNHPFTQCWALNYSMIVQQLAGRLEDLEPLARRAMEVAGNFRFPFWQVCASIMLGWSLYSTGKHRSEGISLMAQGTASFRDQMGAVAFLAYFSSLLAEAYLAEGDTALANSVIESALKLAETQGELWWVPKLLFLKADAIRRDGVGDDSPASQSIASRAKALLKDQGARLLEGQYC